MGKGSDAIRLIDLEPKWLNDTVFIFRCPHCRGTWLSCKIAPMLVSKQAKLFREFNIEMHGPKYGVVPTVKDCAWKLKDGNREFDTMTITPSIDASASGHWHGFITNGSIR